MAHPKLQIPICKNCGIYDQENCKTEKPLCYMCKGHMLVACLEEPPSCEHHVGMDYAITTKEAQDNDNHLIEGKIWEILCNK